VTIDNKRKKIRYVDDFDTSENVLVQGIAGQGKSTFLRYLCSMELQKGKCIPLFLELRKVSKLQTLKERIIAAFKSLGINIDDLVFDALIESGKILLLLDAFDEVPEDLKSVVLADIEDLASAYPTLRIIVTSRPHQSIRVSSHFVIVQLDNLIGDEYKNVIKKMSTDVHLASNLIAHIDKRGEQIREMLCTPLMISLLLLSYKSYQMLPARLSDFYDSLFQTLLQRHDGTKPGFSRHRRCKLDDSKYREVFEALCLFAKRNGKQSFSGETIFDIAKEAIKHCDVVVSPNDYVEDIIQITCLILRDGEEHRFIHKTVHEYYTASYVRKRPEKWARSFYEKTHTVGVHHSWHQELSFLEEIDTYRHNKFYLLPAILAVLNLKETELGPPAKVVVPLDLDRIFHGVLVKYRTEDHSIESIGPFTFNPIIMELFRIVDPDLTNNPNLITTYLGQIGEPTGSTQPVAHPITDRSRKRDIRSVPLTALLKQELSAKLVAKINQEGERLYEKACEIRKTSSAQENASFLDSLV